MHSKGKTMHSKSKDLTASAFACTSLPHTLSQDLVPSGQGCTILEPGAVFAVVVFVCLNLVKSILAPNLNE